MENAQMQDNWLGGLNANQQKALNLLGQGISGVMVASTLGLTEGVISQYLADSRFAEEVTKRKLAALQKQTSVDNKYLEIEDRLLDKLGKVVPLMTKPMDILRGIQVINATKRRGAADGAAAGAAITQIVQINLPSSVAAKFISNGQNQIVEIQDDEGSRSLITSTSEAVNRFAAEVDGQPALTFESSGEERSSQYLIERASERVPESRVSEVIAKGLRRSIEAKAAITADDL